MMLRLSAIVLILFSSSVLSSRLKYRSSVKENVDLYHTITSLDQMLSVNYQQSIEFLNGNAPYTTYFLVDGQKLRTSRLIDREEFCRIKLCENSRCHPCEMEMDFVLKENGQSRDIISLTLTIEDVNEYRPQFFDGDSTSDQQAIQLNISEGVPVGHLLPIQSATDKDGEDEELLYTLEKSSKMPFELVSFGSNQIALNVTEALDRERQDSYELKLTASDRGNLSSTIAIRLSISDINDNVPVFDQHTPYAITVSENTVPSLTQPLLRIHAIDEDSNENGRVTYQFGSQVSESIRQTFQLNSQTGDLYLLRPLDYEQNKEYRIQITAQDSGPVSVPVYTAVLISVEDENDNKPLMTVRFSESFRYTNETLYVSEETALNTLLMHILVQDLDANQNGQVQCWIESLEPILFNITNTVDQMFGIYTSQTFDREEQGNYSLRIIVEDQGVKIRHRTVRDLQLVITDINDCAPRFAHSVYQRAVEEEEDYRQALVQFQATDEDLNENGQISYELLSKEFQPLFYLHEKTGELFLRQKLNREVQAEYNLTIRARDHGTYPTALFTDVRCLITVLDKNEFQPVFQQEKYRFHHLPEDMPVNSSIGFIKATDADQHAIRYSLTSVDFRVDSSTGELFVAKPLDYDSNPSCRDLLATARDSAGWNATCQIELCLEPVNEYSPEIRSESRLIHVNTDNTSWIDIHAFDRDYSPSTVLSFQFEKPVHCNLTFLSNGTIFLPTDQSCLGIVDLALSVDDNDQHPSPRRTNTTIRLIFYSTKNSLQKILLPKNVRWTVELILFSLVLIFLLLIMGVVGCLVYGRRKQFFVTDSTSVKVNQEQLTFPESHCLLNEGVLNATQIKASSSPKTTPNSDSSSSYNDSCYGSSDIDLCHHHHHHHNRHSANQLTGKVLLASNENYIIFCKEPTASNDETKTLSSSSSPSGMTNQLVTRYQMNKRSGMMQHYLTEVDSSNKEMEFFQNDHEYRQVLGSTGSFQCRNITPVNEYYL